MSNLEKNKILTEIIRSSNQILPAIDVLPPYKPENNFIYVIKEDQFHVKMLKIMKNF